MKKLISFILVLCMIFSLAACGAKSPTQPAGTQAPAEKPAPAPDAQTGAPAEGAGTELASPVFPASGTDADPDMSGLDAFIAATLAPMFSDLNGANRVYSPLNVYLALAMLAEITDGATRSQITALLGQDSLETLRGEVQALWEASYRYSDPNTETSAPTILPAASLWLGDGEDYHTDALKALAEYYYASSFSGPMGSSAYTQQLRDWINERTNELLKEQADGLSLDKDTLLALVTTLYFKANWSESFDQNATADDTFRAAFKDETVPFMHRTDPVLYYRGEKFAAVCLPMNGGCGMWILLPDEGVSVEELLAGREAADFLASPEKSGNCERRLVKLSIPKFDVDSDLDLCAMLAKLGVTDVFDPSKSDFKPLTDQNGLAVTDIEHAARVKIDEQGCEAAAFTAITVKGAAFLPEQEIIEFSCDRPFFFSVTGPADQMLFAGAVNTILGS